MKMNMDKLIGAMAEDIRTIVQTIMDSSVADGNRSSIRELKDAARKEDIVVKASMASGSSAAMIEIFYDSYLEWDRKPQGGQWPAESEIREWALSKGLPADNRTLNLVRRSIWWHGHSGRSILDILDKEIDRMFEKEWADKIFDAITAELFD